jgi:hypothetical protein
MFDFTPILQLIAGLIGIFITARIAPCIKNKANAQQFERLQRWTSVVVRAAEQIYREPGNGSNKKIYVCNFLVERGFDYDEDSMNMLIESAVNNMNNERSM